MVGDFIDTVAVVGVFVSVRECWGVGFAIDRDSLARTVNIMVGKITSTSALPVLSNILIGTRSNVLRFRASGCAVSVHRHVTTRIRRRNRVIVPYGVLSGVAGALPSTPIAFRLSRHRILVNYRGDSFHLGALSTGSFPRFPTCTVRDTIRLPASILSRVINHI